MKPMTDHPVEGRGGSLLIKETLVISSGAAVHVLIIPANSGGVPQGSAECWGYRY